MQQNSLLESVVTTLRSILIATALLLTLAALPALAQIPNLTDSTSTPLPAAGHD